APGWARQASAVRAPEPVIRRLEAHPAVWEIRPDEAIPAPEPMPAAATSSTSGTEWNIAALSAREVWALDPLFDGEGTVVGSFDTGVDFTHPDLAPRYRGDHAISWFDPYGERSTPFDPNRHGTHTTATPAGRDRRRAAGGGGPTGGW